MKKSTYNRKANLNLHNTKNFFSFAKYDLIIQHNPFTKTSWRTFLPTFYNHDHKIQADRQMDHQIQERYTAIIITKPKIYFSDFLLWT